MCVEYLSFFATFYSFSPYSHSQIILFQKKKKKLHTVQLSLLTDVNIGHFAENRAIEIQALSEAVKDVGGNHIAFQKLPRHMRRRAMSHNIKRVPRRLHDQVKSEVKVLRLLYCARKKKKKDLSLDALTLKEQMILKTYNMIGLIVHKSCI